MRSVKLLILFALSLPSWADRAVGNFQVAESTGGTVDQTITLGGAFTSVTPVFVILRISALTATGSAAGITAGIGMGASSSAGAEYNGLAVDGSATTFGALRRYTAVANGIVASVVNGSGTTIAEAAIVSFSANTVVIHWSVNDNVARLMDLMVYGGSDFTVAIGQAQAPTSISDTTLTPGFQADALIVLPFGATGTPPQTPTGSSFRPAIGWSTGASNNFTVASVFDNGDKNSASYQNTSHCITVLTTTNTIDQQAAVTAIGATTITLHWNIVNDAKWFTWAALKGGLWSSGTDNVRGTTGSQTVTSGITGTPDGLIIASANRVTSASVTAAAKYSMGFASSASARTARTYTGNSGAGTTSASTNVASVLLNLMTAGGATPSTETSIDLTSFNSGNFIQNVTATDGAGAEFIYLTSAPSSTPATAAHRKKGPF